MQEALRALLERSCGGGAQLNAMLTDEAGYHVSELCGQSCTASRVVGRNQIALGAHLRNQQRARATRRRRRRQRAECLENSRARDALHSHQISPVAVPEQFTLELIHHYLADICEFPSRTQNETCACLRIRI